MDKAEVATEIVILPQTFHNLGNVSMITLLEATDYFRLHDQISEADIREAITRDPECVQEWMQYVDDLRCPGSWYFDFDDDESRYEVGLF